MAKPISKEEFIKRAKAVHGDKYDYSVTVYVNMQHKVDIICPEHGLFSQLPQPHLRGQGCPICGQRKQKQTIIAKYGADNPMKAKSVQSKARQTCIEKYGHAWAMSSDEVKAKVESTNREKYGVNRPIQNVDVHAKLINTVEERYGVNNVMAVPEFKQKHDDACRSHLGVPEPLSSSVVREKIVSTNIEQYGGPAPMSSKDIQQKVSDTCLRKYGFSHYFQSPEIIAKSFESKKTNNSFGKSKIEDIIYNSLCEFFSVDDVVRQYKSEEYPFACDFYIKSRDLYIELNALWTHGDHWFADDVEDRNVIVQWTDKNTKYYKNAIDVWTVKDVEKRRVAIDNSLNYIVFWNNDLSDFYLWLDLGCPDGNDAVNMYSWLK